MKNLSEQCVIRLSQTSTVRLILPLFVCSAKQAKVELSAPDQEMSCTQLKVLLKYRQFFVYFHRGYKRLPLNMEELTFLKQHDVRCMELSQYIY